LTVESPSVIADADDAVFNSPGIDIDDPDGDYRYTLFLLLPCHYRMIFNMCFIRKNHSKRRGYGLPDYERQRKSSLQKNTTKNWNSLIF
jgi:hypothetical protein